MKKKQIITHLNKLKDGLSYEGLGEKTFSIRQTYLNLNTLYGNAQKSGSKPGWEGTNFQTMFRHFSMLTQRSPRDVVECTCAMYL